MKRALLLVSFFLIAFGLSAQSFYVRQAATGDGSGSDWTNAYTALPTSLQRGATYYVAAGDYPAYDFADPESGSTFITIKKATDADHGTDTGWSSQYASGVAHFQNLVFETGYYIIDGQTGGGPASWGSGYGFSIHPDTPQYLVDIRGTNWWNPPLPTNITLEHIDMAGQGYASAPATDGIYAIDRVQSLNSGANNLTIRYCYIHDTATGQIPLYLQWANNVLFEYNYIARNYSTATDHSDAIILDATNNVVVRYNRFEDISGSAIIGVGQGITGTTINNNLQFYGNLFLDTVGSTAGVGLGIVGHNVATGSTGYYVTDAKIYNNTIVRVQGVTAGVTLPNGTGNQVYDNIWWDCVNSTYMAASDEGYNLFINSLKSGWPVASTDIILTSGDPFVDSANNNFALSGPTAPGLVLSAPYNVDMLGTPSAPTGLWDLGAFQYAGAAASTAAPPAPTGLRIQAP